MPYPQAKVYFDGSHFIAIPHTEKPYKPRRKRKEEVVTVASESPSAAKENASTPVSEAQKEERKTTRKELFNELYAELRHVKKTERQEKLVAAMRPYFKSDKSVALFVEENLQRKRRNLITRRIRLTRKVNLQDFNYFVTFTYNGELHTEETFRKSLKKTLANFASRRGWKYMGVWERSPKKRRLHFHGLFNIPLGTMPGLIVEINDYSLSSHRRQITYQNTYFNERFGRSDFEEIADKAVLGKSVAYIMKYLEKTGEKIVYSKGLPQYFISDIMDDDVVCTIGLEDRKLLLFDDFDCWDEGEYIGKVGAETIAQLRKCD